MEQRSRPQKPKKPLTRESLDWFALRYVERFATTQAKLRQYLRDKLRERGWAGEGEPPIDAIVDRMAELRYVDDRAFGEARARSLGRRGYGPRRVGDALAAAGLESELRDEIRGGVDDVEAAITFARRKRLGPFGAAAPSPELRSKQFAAMVRAGHSFDLAKAILAAEDEAALDALRDERRDD
jgi:regulatory protein